MSFIEDQYQGSADTQNLQNKYDDTFATLKKKGVVTQEPKKPTQKVFNFKSKQIEIQQEYLESDLQDFEFPKDAANPDEGKDIH